jgi:hypothetical protein
MPSAEGASASCRSGRGRTGLHLRRSGPPLSLTPCVRCVWLALGWIKLGVGKPARDFFVCAAAPAKSSRRGHR